MSIYIPAAESRTRVLIGKLILSIPELIQELAPNGIENSAFNYMVPKSVEEEYLIYRKNRATKYKLNRKAISFGNTSRKMLRADALRSFEDFKMCFKPAPENMPAEMVYLMEICITHIFGGQCIVHDKNLRSFTMGPEYRSHEFFSNLVNDLNFFEKDYLKHYSFIKLPEVASIDLIPIYEFIFKALKAQNLEWEYRDAYLMDLRSAELLELEEDEEDLETDEEMDDQTEMEQRASKYIRMQLHEEHMCLYGYTEKDHFYDFDYKPVKQRLDIYGNYVPATDLLEGVVGEHEDSHCHLGEAPDFAHSFEEEFDRLQQLKTVESGKVTAYYNVYGKWPKGHPVMKYDYL